MRLRRQGLPLAIVLATLLLIYSPTFLTQINGSSDVLMNDVGEVQIVLNTWGTMHSPGYPLFAILGNLFVAALRAIGIAPVIAPTIFSLMFGLAGLTLLFILTLHLTGRTTLAFIATLLYGLTYYMWLYNVVPSVRSMAFMFELVILILALWKPPIPHRLLWLALIGGIGIAHHRTFLFFAPAILFAVWDELSATLRRRPVMLVGLLAIGLVGFLPYLYLPLRANAGATWVYGTPNTWNGFWDQFLGREYSQMFGLNTSLELIQQFFNEHLDVVTLEVTLPGILLGLLGLGLGVCNPKHRHAALTLILISLVPFTFDMFGTTDHLPPFIMAFALSLIFGWVFLLDTLLESASVGHYARISLAPLTLFASVYLIVLNFGTIYDFTHDPAGNDTIKFAQTVPPGATLMLDWGTRYFAIGFAQDILGQLQSIHRVDHNGDFANIVAHGILVTPDYVFYERPIAWWQDKLKKKTWLRAVAPHLIQIDTAPRIDTATGLVPVTDYDPTVPIIRKNQSVECTTDSIIVQVDWWALSKPARNLSVFVHLTNSTGQLLAQDDQSAPVYGLRPLVSFESGELVHDVYSLPRLTDADTMQYGFFEKSDSGEYKNYAIATLDATCKPTAP